MRENADLLAYVDEAGERGLLRDLTVNRDAKIGLFCALVIPAEDEATVRKAIDPLYQAFKAAAPPGAKLHVTDAFLADNTAWGEVTTTVRENLFDALLAMNMIVVYAARRCSVARLSFENAQALLNNARTERRSEIKIVGENRPSDERIEDEIMTCLALMLDAFTEHVDMKRVDLRFDQIDKEIAERYRDALDGTRKVSHEIHTVKGWNPETKERVEGSVSSTAVVSFRLDSQYLGGIDVVGKDDALVFATDVVTNSLWRHLSSLSEAAALNEASSVAKWRLGTQVWGKEGEKNWDRF